jgi:glucan phosphoethanolaminetransferase (alkaline phosphatase superfamily)
MRFWIGQFFSDRKAHRHAGEEVLFVCLISLIPLFALALIDQIQMSTVQFSLFYEAIAAGQLYLYGFSLLGTLFYLCQKEYENFSRFEPRRYLMFIILIPSIVILIIYARDPAMSKHLHPSLVKASMYIYLLYASLYYILLVFDHLEPPPVEEGLQKAANNLIVEYERTEAEP